jgi:hypothetical protein
MIEADNLPRAPAVVREPGDANGRRDGDAGDPGSVAWFAQRLMLTTAMFVDAAVTATVKMPVVAL